MRHRNSPRTGRVFGLAGAAESLHLEQLEGRCLFSADIAGVRLVLNGDNTAEVRQWTGEHETLAGDTTSDSSRFRLTVNEQRSVGENNFVGPAETNWVEFDQFVDGRLGVDYTGSGPNRVGSAFNAADGYEVGWLLEGASGNPQTLNFLHELPTNASISALSGSWNYSALALPTSGSAKSSTIEGAYGTISITDLLGNFTYGANQIGDSSEGSGQVQSLSTFGLGQIGDSDYFALSSGGNVITAVDLSYGDGLTYIAVAVRRGTGLTDKLVAGEYRFGTVMGGDAASRRGADLLAFESVYLQMNLDGTLTAFDLVDWDAGTETVVHTGRWSLLPEGHTVLVTYSDISEGHLLGFAANNKTFVDLRVSHANGDSYAIGIGERVADDDGSGDGGGGGGGDDHADDGDYSNASPITLSSVGTGTRSGTISPESDTDLFSMTAPTAGDMTIVLNTSQGSLDGSLILKDASGEVLATALAGPSETSVSIHWAVDEGVDYFLVIGSVNQGSTGAYTVSVTTADNSGGGGGGGGYEDDFGSDDDGTGDVLNDNVPFPRMIVAGRAPTGRQAVWERGQDHQWYYSKLGLRSDTPGIIGELVTWRDEITDEYMVAASTENGLILWVRDEDEGAYIKRDLTEESGEDAEIPAGPVTYFTLDDGRNVLTALNAEGDVIAYIESQGSTFFLNLSQVEIRDNDKIIPALTGTLTAGVSTWGTTMIAGLDEEGKVWTVWFSIQNSRDGWQASPLSKIAKAQPIAGSLSIYFTDWNGINVAGLGDTGETRVIWWVPGFGGDWEVSNLTTKFDGPSFKAGSMTTYTTPWNSLTVIGVTTDQRLVAYWWSPGFDAWVISDFSELLPQQQPRVIRGQVTASVRPTNDIWLFGRDNNEEMIRIVWTRSQDSWASSSMVTNAEQF
jgi:hypothetical protein